MKVSWDKFLEDQIRSGKFRKVKIGSDEVQRGQDQTSRKLKFWLSK